MLGTQVKLKKKVSLSKWTVVFITCCSARSIRLLSRWSQRLHRFVSYCGSVNFRSERFDRQMFWMHPEKPSCHGYIFRIEPRSK
ncbi:hypothetical protein TNCV_2837111 [Trichonephila clavipes]|nr:hypothetical protein TNCV_2837111 [Trichonephila clavipes]